MNKRIGGLGEVAFRVNDLKRMSDFYESVIGLEVMSRNERMTFFRIAEGFAGHTQILALFDRQKGSTPDGGQLDREYTPPSAAHSSVDHIAFSIAKENFEPEVKRLQALGIKVVQNYHEWVQWRSLFIEDPEGNTVELVCYDPQSKSDLG